MSTGFKRVLIAIAVVQLLVTTVIAYKAERDAASATRKACAVAALTLAIDYEACVAR